MKKVEQRATLRFASVLTHSDNKRVSGSGFQPSPKSPSATSDTRQPLSEIAGDGGDGIKIKCTYRNYINRRCWYGQIYETCKKGVTNIRDKLL